MEVCGVGEGQQSEGKKAEVEKKGDKGGEKNNKGKGPEPGKPTPESESEAGSSSESESDSDLDSDESSTSKPTNLSVKLKAAASASAPTLKTPAPKASAQSSTPTNAKKTGAKKKTPLLQLKRPSTPASLWKASGPTPKSGPVSALESSSESESDDQSSSSEEESDSEGGEMDFEMKGGGVEPPDGSRPIKKSKLKKGKSIAYAQVTLDPDDNSTKTVWLRGKVASVHENGDVYIKGHKGPMPREVEIKEINEKGMKFGKSKR